MAQHPLRRQAGAEHAVHQNGLTDMDKVVLSPTLAEPLAWANTGLVSGGAADVVREMKQDHNTSLRTIGNSVSISPWQPWGRAGLDRHRQPDHRRGATGPHDARGTRRNP